MYGLYIYSNDFTPQIHAFSTVDEARAFATQMASDRGISLDLGNYSDESGFYAESDMCGILEFECRPITDHRPDDVANWRRQALEENAALDILRTENERLGKAIRKICAEDGYSCTDCVNQDCPFCPQE